MADFKILANDHLKQEKQRAQYKCAFALQDDSEITIDGSLFKHIRVHHYIDEPELHIKQKKGDGSREVTKFVSSNLFQGVCLARGLNADQFLDQEEINDEPINFLEQLATAHQKSERSEKDRILKEKKKQWLELKVKYKESMDKQIEMKKLKQNINEQKKISGYQNLKSIQERISTSPSNVKSKRIETSSEKRSELQPLILKEKERPNQLNFSKVPKDNNTAKNFPKQDNQNVFEQQEQKILVDKQKNHKEANAKNNIQIKEKLQQIMNMLFNQKKGLPSPSLDLQKDKSQKNIIKTNKSLLQPLQQNEKKMNAEGDDNDDEVRLSKSDVVVQYVENQQINQFGQISEQHYQNDQVQSQQSIHQKHFLTKKKANSSLMQSIHHNNDDFCNQNKELNTNYLNLSYHTIDNSHLKSQRESQSQDNQKPTEWREWEWRNTLLAKRFAAARDRRNCHLEKNKWNKQNHEEDEEMKKEFIEFYLTENQLKEDEDQKQNTIQNRSQLISQLQEYHNNNNLVNSSNESETESKIGLGDRKRMNNCYYNLGVLQQLKQQEQAVIEQNKLKTSIKNECKNFFITEKNEQQEQILLSSQLIKQKLSPLNHHNQRRYQQQRQQSVSTQLEQEEESKSQIGQEGAKFVLYKNQSSQKNFIQAETRSNTPMLNSQYRQQQDEIMGESIQQQLDHQSNKFERILLRKRRERKQQEQIERSYGKKKKFQSNNISRIDDSRNNNINVVVFTEASNKREDEGEGGFYQLQSEKSNMNSSFIKNDSIQENQSRYNFRINSEGSSHRTLKQCLNKKEQEKFVNAQKEINRITKLTKKCQEEQRQLSQDMSSFSYDRVIKRQQQILNSFHNHEQISKNLKKDFTKLLTFKQME